MWILEGGRGRAVGGATSRNEPRGPGDSPVNAAAPAAAIEPKKTITPYLQGGKTPVILNGGRGIRIP